MTRISDIWQKLNKAEMLDETTGLISTDRYYPCDICNKVTGNVLPRTYYPDLHVCSVECKNAVFARDAELVNQPSATTSVSAMSTLTIDPESSSIDT